MVIWITGLACAGKTSLGKCIYGLWRKRVENVVLVDGDEIRAIFRFDRTPDHYTLAGRKKNSERIREICAWLDRQGINVVCCTLSMFDELSDWNRRTYSKYFEIYLSTPFDVVRKRDKKGLYEPALRGELENVVGVDISYYPPRSPDYEFANLGDEVNLKVVAAEVLTQALASVRGSRASVHDSTGSDHEQV